MAEKYFLTLSIKLNELFKKDFVSFLLIIL